MAWTFFRHLETFFNDPFFLDDNSRLPWNIDSWILYPQIPTGDSSEEREELISDHEQSMASLPHHPNRSYLARRWKGLDRLYFKPLLTHVQPNLMETLPKELTFLGKCFTSDIQLESRSREIVDSRNGDEIIGESAKDQDDPLLLGSNNQN